MPTPHITTGGRDIDLPMPMQNGYFEETFNPGTVHRLASGRIARESTYTGLYNRFVLEWDALDINQRDQINLVVGDMLDGSTATFTRPTTGATVTVVLGENVPRWEAYTIGSGGAIANYRFKGSLELEAYF